MFLKTDLCGEIYLTWLQIKSFEYYGRFNTDGMIPIYAVCGVAYGMVELIRRIIPRDIVGGNVQKLRRMDSVVRLSHGTHHNVGSM